MVGAAALLVRFGGGFGRQGRHQLFNRKLHRAGHLRRAAALFLGFGRRFGWFCRLIGFGCFLLRRFVRRGCFALRFLRRRFVRRRFFGFLCGRFLPRPAFSASCAGGSSRAGGSASGAGAGGSVVGSAASPWSAGCSCRTAAALSAGRAGFLRRRRRFLGAGVAAPSPGVSGVVGSIFLSSICVTFCPPAGGASLYRNSHGGFSAVFLVLQAARTADRRGRVNRFAADAKFINQVMGVGGKADGISLDNVLPFLHLDFPHAEEIALDAAAMVDDYGCRPTWPACRQRQRRRFAAR